MAGERQARILAAAVPRTLPTGIPEVPIHRENVSNRLDASATGAYAAAYVVRPCTAERSIRTSGARCDGVFP
jgi:hypothetical protein